MHQLVYTKQARKDAKKIASSGLKNQAKKLLERLQDDPYFEPPPYKYLLGDLEGAVSRRINYQHRLVYQVLEQQKVVKIIRMWSHYE